MTLMVSLGSGAAFAQTPETAPANSHLILDPVEVLAPSVPKPLSASPLEREPSAATSTVDLDDRRTESKNLAEIVAALPGVVARDTGGLGQTKVLSIRGSSPNAVLVLFDGIALQSTGAAVDLSRLPTALFSKVEVLRGVASRYQPGAMGGVVNLVSRDTTGQRAFGGLSYGSFSSSEAHVGATAEIAGGNGLVLLHGLTTQGDFGYTFDATPNISTAALVQRQRENNSARQLGALLKWKRFWGNTRVDALVDVAAEGRGLAGTVYNPTPTAAQQSMQSVAALRLSHQFEHQGELLTTVSMRTGTLALQNTGFGAENYQQDDVSLNTEVQYARALGAHRFEALVSGGTDTLGATDNARIYNGRAAAMVGLTLSGLAGRLQVLPSVRVDVDGPFVVVSPKLGATALLGRQFTLRANVGQASRPPSFLERFVRQGAVVPNANLQAERAIQGDLAVSWAFDSGSLSLGGFYGLTGDLISYELYPPMVLKPFNFATVAQAGLEAEGQADVNAWLGLRAAYTYLRATNVRDTPRYYGHPLPFRPEHVVTAGARFGPAAMHLQLDGVFSSAQFQNRTATLSVPARALVNVGLHGVFSGAPQVRWGAELKNIFDVSTVDVSAYPLAPRAFFLTAALSWESTHT